MKIETLSICHVGRDVFVKSLEQIALKLNGISII